MRGMKRIMVTNLLNQQEYVSISPRQLIAIEVRCQDGRTITEYYRKRQRYFVLYLDAVHHCEVHEELARLYRQDIADYETQWHAARTTRGPQ